MSKKINIIAVIDRLEAIYDGICHATYSDVPFHDAKADLRNLINELKFKEVEQEK